MTNLEKTLSIFSILLNDLGTLDIPFQIFKEDCMSTSPLTTEALVSFVVYYILLVHDRMNLLLNFAIIWIVSFEENKDF